MGQEEFDTIQIAASQKPQRNPFSNKVALVYLVGKTTRT